MVTAIVLIKALQGCIPELAEKLSREEGVAEVYSVAGDYDLVAIARVPEHDDLADLVAGRLQQHAGIAATQTLIAFRAYSQKDLAAMWDIGFEEKVD